MQPMVESAGRLLKFVFLLTTETALEVPLQFLAYLLTCCLLTVYMRNREIAVFFVCLFNVFLIFYR